jgi:hypothetical protein
MEWKALMAYLSNNLQNLIFYFLSPDALELQETFIDFIKYIVESKQLKKIKQELIN